MRKVRKEEEKKEETNIKYLPMTFEKMISFLSYRIRREDLEKQILDGVKLIKHKEKHVRNSNIYSQNLPNPSHYLEKDKIEEFQSDFILNQNLEVINFSFINKRWNI